MKNYNGLYFSCHAYDSTLLERNQTEIMDCLNSMSQLIDEKINTTFQQQYDSIRLQNLLINLHTEAGVKDYLEMLNYSTKIKAEILTEYESLIITQLLDTGHFKKVTIAVKADNIRIFI